MKSKNQSIYAGISACVGLVLLLSFQNCSQNGFNVSTQELTSGVGIDTDSKALGGGAIRDCLVYTLDDSGNKNCSDPGIKSILNSAVLTLEKSEGPIRKISILGTGEVFLLRSNLSHFVLAKLSQEQISDLKASIQGSGSVSLFVATRRACLVAGPVTTIQMNKDGNFVQIFKMDCNVSGMNLDPESAEARTDLQAMIEMMLEYEKQAHQLPSGGDPGKPKICPLNATVMPRCKAEQNIVCKSSVGANGCNRDECGCEDRKPIECPAQVTGFPICEERKHLEVSSFKDPNGCQFNHYQCVDDEIRICPMPMIAMRVCMDGEVPELQTGNFGMPGCEFTFPSCQLGAQTQ